MPLDIGIEHHYAFFQYLGLQQSLLHQQVQGIVYSCARDRGTLFFDILQNLISGGMFVGFEDEINNRDSLGCWLNPAITKN